MSDGSSDLFYNVKFSRELSINFQNNIIDEMIINKNLINESLINESLIDETPNTNTSSQSDIFEEDICYINICHIIVGVFATIVTTVGIYILVTYF